MNTLNSRRKMVTRTLLLLCAFFSILVTPAQPVSVSIGTLAPGESVTITYEVTIDSTLPPAVTQISSQGSISGSNFASFDTDDPETPAAGDATITSLQNDAPIIIAGNTASFSEGGSAVPVSPSLTVTDVDSANLTSASVSITSGLVSGDTLAFTDQNGITGSYDSGTGILTLTGSSTVANYQSALRSVTYSTTSENPTDFGASPDRTITFVANDGVADSLPATATVNIFPLNQAPVLSAADTVSYTEAAAPAVISPALTVADVDNVNLSSASVSISSGFVSGDTLGFADQNGISGSYDPGTGVLTLTGSSSIANYQTALRSVTYSTSSENPTDFGSSPNRTVTFTANDGVDDSLPSSATINITTIDHAPVLAAGNTISYTELDAPTPISPALTVTDVDSANLSSASVSISTGFVAGDTLGFVDQNGISGSYDSGNGVLTLTGSATVANYQTALRSVTYSTSSGNPTDFGASPDRTVTFTANDGITDSPPSTATINITAVNQAPSLAAGNTISYAEAAAPAVISPALTVSDVDSVNLFSATVSITSGFVSGDTLGFADQNGITGSYDSGTGVLTLTGSSTVANYQTALRSVTYSTLSENPTDFGSSPNRTVTFTANDGFDTSLPSSSTINITTIDQAPIVAAANTVSYTEGASPEVISPALTVTDVDNANLSSASVSISTGFVAGDTLGFVDQNGISGSYDSGTGVLTLTGSTTVANYQGALRTVTYSTSSQNPTSFGTTPDRTVTFIANDGTANSLPSSATINITAINQAPSLTAGNTTSYTERAGQVAVSPALTAADADSTSLTGANVSISADFVAGDTLGFTDQNGITGSYDSNTGVLTLTGGSSVANYQAALASVTYSSTSHDPTANGAHLSRTITFVSTDGSDSSAPATATINITAVNDNPVAADDTIQRGPNDDVKVRIATLLTNDTDAENDSITFTGVISPSAGGATVQVSGEWILFSHNGTTADTFSYTISDGHGGTATGTVHVDLQDPDTQSSTSIDIAVDGSGAHLTFDGIPGRTYIIQFRDDINDPWQDQGTATEGAPGAFQYNDPVGSMARFYRYLYR